LKISTIGVCAADTILASPEKCPYSCASGCGAMVVKRLKLLKNSDPIRMSKICAAITKMEVISCMHTTKGLNTFENRQQKLYFSIPHAYR